MANEFIIKNGFFSQGSSDITGSLTVSQGITGSLFGTASYTVNSLSSSYSANADLLDGKDSTVFATTGSNTFIGNQVISGSVTITGSLLISGSTTQIGNNNLLGNTTLSGSVIISGSTTTPTTPSIKIYGDLETNGVMKFTPVIKNIDTSISASYVYVSGSTNDIYFSQNGSGYSNATRLRWLESVLYTGLLKGGNMTSTPGTTTFTVASGSGLIVNQNASLAADPFPTIAIVDWAQQTLPITYSGSAKITYVGIDNTGAIIQQPYAWGSLDVTQWDTAIHLGVVLHLSGSVSTGVFNSPQISYGPAQRQDDFFRAFGPLKVSGHTLLASGSTLGISKAAGTAYKEGANYINNPNHPSTVVENAITTSKIYRYYISGSTPVIDTGVANAGYNVIDPTRYVNTATGQLVTVTGNNSNQWYWTIQRVFWVPNSPTNAFIVYYGNAEYATLNDAKNGIDTEAFTEAPNTALNAILLGYILVRKGCTDLSDTTSTNAVLIQGGLFRTVSGIGGSGASTITSLATLSDVLIATPTEGQTLAYNSSISKWVNTSSLNVSISGNAATATTASYVTLAQTASYVENAQSASYLTNPVFKSVGQNPVLYTTATGLPTSSYDSVIINTSAGYITGSVSSTIIGPFAGRFISRSVSDVIIGKDAATLANNLVQNILIGQEAGYSSSMMTVNIAVGPSALTNSDGITDSIAIGTYAGANNNNTTSSIYIGYQAGQNTDNSKNNVIIGNYQSLESGRKNSLNLAGVIFSTASADLTEARVGIMVNTPTSASLQVNGNVWATSYTGSLLGTASYAENAQTASYIDPLFVSASAAFYGFNVSSSYSTTASYTDPLFISASAAAAGFGPVITAGGVNGQIQYNNNSAFSGVSVLTYDGSILRGTGSFSGSFSGYLEGTASYANLANSASYVESASYSLTSNLSNNTILFNGSDKNVFATTGSNSFTGEQTINGSLTITQNLTVLGSSSIQYITSSQLVIADNIISVNTFSPSLRFGGLAVIDSGSVSNASGSLLFDSQNNQWIFVHQSEGSSAVTSSVLIMGPQTFDNVGNETTITSNRLTKGTGGDLGEHIGDSNITDTGTVVSINSATEITGSVVITAGVTGSSFNISNAPTLNNTNTQILTRNSTTGQIEYSNQS